MTPGSVIEYASEPVVDPARWPDLLEQISCAIGGMGAMLLPFCGAGGVEASPSMTAALEAYVSEGWHEGERDPRRRAIRLHMQGQVATDEDIISNDEIRRDPMYNELLPRFDAKWWAGIGFKANREHWCLALHRSSGQGPFERTDKAIFQEFATRLSEIGTLAHIVGHAAISEVTSSFDKVRHAVIAIDAAAQVIRTNALADRIFDDEFRIFGKRLVFGDKVAEEEFGKALGRLRSTAEGRSLRATPIVVRRRIAPPLLIEVLPLDGAVRSPFFRARALLLLTEIVPPSRPAWELLSRAFELTPAEARLASQLATGKPLEQAADESCISKETARNQLKSIFRKTSVHRQAELIALMSPFLRSV